VLYASFYILTGVPPPHRVLPAAAIFQQCLGTAMLVGILPLAAAGFLVLDRGPVNGRNGAGLPAVVAVSASSWPAWP